MLPSVDRVERVLSRGPSRSRRSGGTMAGLRHLSDIASAVLIAAGDRLFFTADDPVDDAGSTASDSVNSDARPVRGTFSGSSGSDVAETTVGHGLFFAADDGIHGIALWASDGTRAGTRLVAARYARPK
jgi:ELWxxDGT repeat protein